MLEIHDLRPQAVAVTMPAAVLVAATAAVRVPSAAVPYRRVRELRMLVRVVAHAPLEELLGEIWELEARRLVAVARQHDDAAEQSAVHTFADMAGNEGKRTPPPHNFIDVGGG